MSSMAHHMLSVGYFSIDYHSNMFINIEYSRVGPINQQFREHQFLSTQDHSIFAFNSYDSSTLDYDRIYSAF